VPWLLTLGLVIATFAIVWQDMESGGRESSESLLLPVSVPHEPAATLVARIRASWEPGDRLRTALLFVGLSLCAAAAWRAWRVEGLPASTLRRVALTLAILGVSSLALVFFRARTHPRDSGSGTLVPVHYPERRGVGSGPVDIGFAHVHGTGVPAAMGPLRAVGEVWLALGVSLGFLSLLYARRVARVPHASPARSAPRRGGG
jgi:hypothetical protein